MLVTKVRASVIECVCSVVTLMFLYMLSVVLSVVSVTIGGALMCTCLTFGVGVQVGLNVKGVVRFT